MTLRTQQLFEFLAAQIPAPPARVLDVGCGEGELAHALVDAGFDVTAIDPGAPEGAMFRRVGIEDFSDPDGFDAVVASVSLHHVDDLPSALDKVEALLRPAGVIVVEEFARERLVGATARWYHAQLWALAHSSRAESAPPSNFSEWEQEQHAYLAHLHPAEMILAELAQRFETRHLEWGTYLYSWRLDDTLEPVEQALVDKGAIQATGVRYLGRHR